MRIVAFGLDNYGQTSKVSNSNYHVSIPPPFSTGVEDEPHQKNNLSSSSILTLDPKPDQTGMFNSRKFPKSLSCIKPSQIYYRLTDANSTSKCAFGVDGARAVGSCEFAESPNCDRNAAYQSIVAADTHQTVVYSQSVDTEPSDNLIAVLIDDVLDAAYCNSESRIYAIVSISQPQPQTPKRSGTSACTKIVSISCATAAGASPRSSSPGNCVSGISDVGNGNRDTRLERLGNNNPVSIDAGYSHVVACCSDGQVYAAFTSNMCGQFHTLFVDADGFLFSCGLNNYGQLGRSDPSATTAGAQSGASCLVDGNGNDSIQSSLCARLSTSKPAAAPVDDAFGISDFTVPEPVTEFMKHGSAVDPVVTDIACGTYHSLINTGLFFLKFFLLLFYISLNTYKTNIRSILYMD
ncbi:hypothetical protein AYI69_g9290 [Smittium culicis]|uniref:Uncharacterized protein n=1 Tax=Smittium culicis TaxID=133412 RepID=A0A1R1XDK8_9FUNG|nr:hypothetical protein AYI69_g9290 [Smittium culicis]